MGTIDLSTPVRKTLEHKITLENPLDTPVTFSVTCPSEIQIPSQFVVQKGSKVNIKISRCDMLTIETTLHQRPNDVDV